jgi:hypothetical protein
MFKSTAELHSSSAESAAENDPASPGSRSDWLLLRTRDRRFARRSGILQQLAVSDTPRQLLSSYSVKPRFVAVNSGHVELPPFGWIE